MASTGGIALVKAIVFFRLWNKTKIMRQLPQAKSNQH